jgi:predicted RNA polymerase sigma factor
VLQVLYLIFNEGYTASSGSELHRVELTAEAIRLTRQLHDRLPDDGEIAGLLALMLLTDARRPARTRADGALIPLAEQDRGSDLLPAGRSAHAQPARATLSGVESGKARQLAALQ